PVFLTYVLSFIFVGIYWSNHHHMFHAVKHVNGAVLWANLHLLFWLSPVPVFGYGVVLFGSACAYTILVRALRALHDADSLFARAVGRDSKGWLSLALYVAGLLLAFVHPLSACAMYVIIAFIWLVPDRRFERLVARVEG